MLTGTIDANLESIAEQEVVALCVVGAGSAGFRFLVTSKTFVAREGPVDAFLADADFDAIAENVIVALFGAAARAAGAFS